MPKRKHSPIEPKPTAYGNTLFRSRLEARWAVFLDFTENVLNWEYEPKTFKLSNGWTYTPDFRVKLFQLDRQPKTIYLEVKPTRVTPSYEEVLDRFVAVHRIVLVIAAGDFYSDTLCIDTLHTNLSGYKSVEILASNLFVNPQRGVYHASHFRFDLEQT